jgi:ubiquinone/menaquinone biosynthesis C-methylase UbiE
MASEEKVPDRDVHAFDRRANDYDEGRHGQLHHDISDRVVTLAIAVHPTPRRILDVGCGTGYVIKSLADRVPNAEQIVGIDPAPTMVKVARANVPDPRARVDSGVAEHLPYADKAFDLVVSTTSFDHWSDQGRGLRECARVLAPGGHCRRRLSVAT